MLLALLMTMTLDLPRCMGGNADAPDALRRAALAVGLRGEGMLRVRGWRATVNDFQSDRSYQPFFSSFQSLETFFDARGGGLATRVRGGAYPGFESQGSPFLQLSGPWASWVIRDTLVRAAGTGADARPLDPHAVLADFIADRSVTVRGSCPYRDYPRIGLVRRGVYGDELLLLDQKTHVPVALLREEPHFLWGQVAVEYVWSNWDLVDNRGGLFPQTAFRVVDSVTILSNTVTTAARVPADSAPRLALPDTAWRAPLVDPFFAPRAPDTVRVSDNTWLLVNPSYTITVTLLRDTVFVLDATLGETRARQDADWVARLFPGTHPVVLVVTDLAWPHIAGVRYWVASGATVVSHRAARPFLERVVNRRWTREPDLLEQRRARARLRFRPVTDSLRLAGGELVLHAIDGVASEVALMAWLPGERYLWPGDYIQNTRQPTGYASEVLAAVRRLGLAPERFAAQHVALTPWSTIEGLFVH